MLADYMSKHNLSKTAFCKLCDISPSTLARIFAHNPNILSITFFKIAKAMDVMMQDLVTPD